MAHIVGQPQERKRLPLLTAMMARVSEQKRIDAEREAGEGQQRLLELVQTLPDYITAVMRPTLGFGMKVDCCLIGPGQALVINVLHTKGKIVAGQKEEWRSETGAELGRPDRGAHIFYDRLRFSEAGRGFDLRPVVIFTAEPVDFQAPQPLAELIGWSQAGAKLRELFPVGGQGFDLAPLISLITMK